jgi:hypothetical protein
VDQGKGLLQVRTEKQDLGGECITICRSVVTSQKQYRKMDTEATSISMTVMIRKSRNQSELD